MCTTVDDHVDKSGSEHTFDRLIWAFRFHTVCGKPWFKYTLKVVESGVSTV